MSEQKTEKSATFDPVKQELHVHVTEKGPLSRPDETNPKNQIMFGEHRAKIEQILTKEGIKNALKDLETQLHKFEGGLKTSQEQLKSFPKLSKEQERDLKKFEERISRNSFKKKMEMLQKYKQRLQAEEIVKNHEKAVETVKADLKMFKDAIGNTELQ